MPTRRPCAWCRWSRGLANLIELAPQSRGIPHPRRWSRCRDDRSLGSALRIMDDVTTPCCARGGGDATTSTRVRERLDMDMMRLRSQLTESIAGGGNCGTANQPELTSRAGLNWALRSAVMRSMSLIVNSRATDLVINHGSL